MSMTTTTMGYYNMKKYNYDTIESDLTNDEKDNLQTKLYNHLCTDHNVGTNSVKMSETNYYGYMAAMNPVPCAEALLSMAWGYVQTLPYVSAGWMPAEVWMPHEDFVQCSVSYAGTLDAYTEVYKASFLSDGGNNPVWTDSDKVMDDMLFTITFYAWFGLFWIHGSYPNYLMSDVSSGYGPDDYDYSTPIGYDSD